MGETTPGLHVRRAWPTSEFSLNRGAYPAGKLLAFSGSVPRAISSPSK